MPFLNISHELRIVTSSSTMVQPHVGCCLLIKKIHAELLYLTNIPLPLGVKNIACQEDNTFRKGVPGLTAALGDGLGGITVGRM